MNIASIDLNLLRVFDAIVRHGNLTVAGESIGLSQPAMSNALGRLRALFDDVLFVRSGHGMKPTEYAMALAVPIREALDLLDRSLRIQARFDPAKSDRCFHICTTDIGEIVFLPNLLKRLQEIAPSVALKCGQYGTREIREMLASGDLDLALGYMPELSTGIYQRLLFDEHYVCMVRKHHPRIRGALTRAAFFRERHAIVASPGTGHAALREQLSGYEEKCRTILEMHHFASVPLIIANTDLVVTVPSRLGTLYEALLPVRLLAPPIEMPSFKIKQFWHERNHHDPASIWLRGVIAELFAYPEGTAYMPSVRERTARAG